MLLNFIKEILGSGEQNLYLKKKNKNIKCVKIAI